MKEFLTAVECSEIFRALESQRDEMLREADCFESNGLDSLNPVVEEQVDCIEEIMRKIGPGGGALTGLLLKPHQESEPKTRLEWKR